MLEGKDAMPRLIELAAKKLGEGINADSLGRYFAEAGDSAEEQALSLGWPLLWELTRLFGAVPAPGDRHIVEFFPHMYSAEKGYYGKTLGVNAFSLERCIESGHAAYAQMKKEALSPDPLADDHFVQRAGEHEQVFAIVESIRTNAGRIFSANLPNMGQIPNLPHGAIVECPAIATSTGLHAIHTKPVATGIAGALASRFACVEVTVEAALEGSRDKLVQALMIDGAVKSVETACRLADELLAAQKQYLPQFA